MKKKFSRFQLITWLKKVTNVSLLSISLLSGPNIHFEMNNNVTPQVFVTQVNLNNYPTGQYLVDYKYEDESQNPDPLYCETIMALYYDITLKTGGEIENIDCLESKSIEYPYISISDDRNNGYRLKQVLIKKPELPDELFGLINTLNKYACFVAVYEDQTDLFAHAYINGVRASGDEAQSRYSKLMMKH